MFLSLTFKTKWLEAIGQLIQILQSNNVCVYVYMCVCVCVCVCVHVYTHTLDLFVYHATFWDLNFKLILGSHMICEIWRNSSIHGIYTQSLYFAY